MYGEPEGLTSSWCALGDLGDERLPNTRAANYREMVDKISEAVKPAFGDA
jgi:hypothetical protein